MLLPVKSMAAITLLVTVGLLAPPVSPAEGVPLVVPVGCAGWVAVWVPAGRPVNASLPSAAVVVVAVTGLPLMSVPLRATVWPPMPWSLPLIAPLLSKSRKTVPEIRRPFGISASYCPSNAVPGGRTRLEIRLGVVPVGVAVPAVPPFGTAPAEVVPLAVLLG